MLPILKSDPDSYHHQSSSNEATSTSSSSALAQHLAMPIGGLQQQSILIQTSQLPPGVTPMPVNVTMGRQPGPPPPLPIFQHPPQLGPGPQSQRPPIRYPAPVTSFGEQQPGRQTQQVRAAIAPVQQQQPNALRLASPAIRQALGHPSTSLNSISSQAEELLDRKRLDELVRLVDPTETLEEDVKDALLQLTDDFIEQLLDQSCRMARHRNADRLEANDVNFVLQRLWNIWLPGTQQQSPLKPANKSPANEAHKQRLAIIKKTLKKP